MNWTGRRVLVTGGASFIGSHLTEALIQNGARVRVADNMSSGTRENLAEPLRAERTLKSASLRYFTSYGPRCQSVTR